LCEILPYSSELVGVRFIDDIPRVPNKIDSYPIYLGALEGSGKA